MKTLAPLLVLKSFRDLPSARVVEQAGIWFELSALTQIAKRLA